MQTIDRGLRTDRHGKPSCAGSACRGYTLIEVLLTGTIVLIAMTGILTTQMVGIKITQNAYHRTQATTLAYQMTDYLRANCSALSDYVSLSLCRSGNRAANDKRNCTIEDASDISADNTTVVDDDLRAWWTAIDGSGLPNWYATIAQAANTGLVYVVVQWDDTHSTESSMNPSELEESKTSCLETAFPSSETAIPAPMEEVCLTTLPCAL